MYTRVIVAVLIIVVSVLAFLYLLNSVAFCVWMGGHPLYEAERALWTQRVEMLLVAILLLLIADVASLYFLFRVRRR